MVMVNQSPCGGPIAGNGFADQLVFDGSVHAVFPI